MVKAKEQIQEYWDGRAKDNANSLRATTDDLYLRRLELATLAETIGALDIRVGGTVLDVGCGDGHTTLEVAQALPGLRFLGVDYSANMIENARRQLAARPEMQPRVAFKVGDATNLEAACGGEQYDLVMTDRCLINLPSLASQAEAIGQIAARTRPHGYYVAIENFVEGQDSMNALRQAVGLPEIRVRWHNLYFKETDFIAQAAPFFDEITFRDFCSSYYFATRVVYSAMCQMRGEQPDYEHEIHQLAIKLPWTGQFSPIRMVVLRRTTS